jgi:hypothetical protein
VSSVSDILAHLRPCPVQVDFLGHAYTIPALDAAQWVALIDGQHPDLYEIFPVLAGPEAVEAVEDALWDGHADEDDVAMVALNALGAAGSLVHVNGAVGMSLAGWLDEVWSKVMQHIDPKKRTQWISEVERAPKGLKQEIDFDEEERAFLAAMNAVMR